MIEDAKEKVIEDATKKTENQKRKKEEGRMNKEIENFSKDLFDENEEEEDINSPTKIAKIKRTTKKA